MPRPLNIVLVCQQDLGAAPHPVPAYRFWRTYFVHALKEAGHHVIEIPACDWAAGLLPLAPPDLAAWRDRTWETALNGIRAEHSRRGVDLFLAYLYPNQIHPAALDEIHHLGIPRVNFFCDNVREFRHLPPEFTPFDLHWVPETAALPLYKRASLPHLHAPMPCWVAPDLRTPPNREAHPVSFIGTRDELRAALFAEAFNHGLDARLWGRGWLPSTDAPALPAPTSSRLRNQLAFLRQHGLSALGRKILEKLHPPQRIQFDFAPFAGPLVNTTELVEITRESIVCLGVNRYPSPRHSPSRPATYSRLRDLEAPMLGACYLTEWTEGIDQLYEPGTEIETYRDAAELVEKTRALTADPARRARLRTAGQRRALVDHSIPRTLDRISTRLGLG